MHGQSIPISHLINIDKIYLYTEHIINFRLIIELLSFEVFQEWQG